MWPCMLQQYGRQVMLACQRQALQESEETQAPHKVVVKRGARQDMNQFRLWLAQ
jgi:hypothetical protein